MAKILVVDDDKDSCETLAHLFNRNGHEATCVPNGKEALAHVLKDPPDVIVLDLLMPEMDGPSLLEVLRSYLRLQSLPVVILTALHDSPMLERARALKVNSILLKGKATPEDIMREVESAIFRHPG